MLYLIGGPGRSGKTTLALRLLRLHGIPYFSLDYLMMGLYHGATSLEINPNNPEWVVAPRMWSVVRPMLTAMLENGERYCVEGFALKPQGIHELELQFPGAISACCLGYCEADPEAKLKQEREHPSTNAWPLDLEPAAALRELESFRAASIELKAECAEQGIAFFDTSAEFEAVIALAAQFLTKELQ